MSSFFDLFKIIKSETKIIKKRWEYEIRIRYQEIVFSQIERDYGSLKKKRDLSLYQQLGHQHPSSVRIYPLFERQ